MIEVNDIRKTYGSVVAVQDVSLRAAPGEILGLLGPNGAGKTTTVSIVAGLVRPDSGQVLIDGLPLAGDTDPAKRKLGLVPQDIALYDELPAQENLVLFGALYGLAGAPARTAIGAALDLVGLADRAADKVKTYSGGMKRRLNLAAALLHDPQVLLLDEPTAGVDPQSRNAIFDNLMALRGRGKTILYTTHYMEEAERLCDRIAIIDHGRIIALGTNEELVHNAFASRSQVTARFAGTSPEIAAWVERRGGHIVDGSAQFTIASSIEIVGLLQDAEKDGLELADVSLRRPNLESVFLHLTGRELRD